jgi:luciferase family oxidoreductase group 1
MPLLKLSILDQSPVRKGGTARQALLETVQLAQLAERLGYGRYWVSEHHNTRGLAGSAPEVLLAHLAAHTSRIRLGSGGVMLPNHSALKVAENFRLLESLAPGRIDLGIGRAPGTDRLTAALLNPGNTFSEKAFVQQLVDLQDFLHDAFDSGRGAIRATPAADTVPELWLLSSSGESGLFAAHFGTGFSFAHFINPVGGPQMVKAYKEHFKPSESFSEPQANVAAFVLCADTEEKALELQAVMDLQLLRIGKGLSLGFPPYEDVVGYAYSPEETAQVQHNRRRMVVGTPGRVKAQLLEMAAAYGVDELVIVTITHDFADRVRSYELLAEAFGLPGFLPAGAGVPAASHA